MTENEWSGAYVFAIRAKLRMTQEQFAHACGVTVSTVNRWENDHAKPSPLARKTMLAVSPVATPG